MRDILVDTKMVMNLLNRVACPEDLKAFTRKELVSLCEEIRAFLITSISKTGGHIGPNLGVVELTVALHYVFDLPKDELIFDTGHQGYVHKLLTGRRALFPTLNQPGGMSRFLAREESAYDIIDASHGGTAVSIASGVAWANKANGSPHKVVAVVGDGALVEGMSAEGVNYVTEEPLPLIIVINDNGMAIPQNVGGVHNMFSGTNWIAKSKCHFEGLGYQYIAVRNGHNIDELIDSLIFASNNSANQPMIVHVKTEKGRGLGLAKKHKYKLHFSMPFDPLTGEGSIPIPTGRTYATVAGEKLEEILENSDDIVVITPATPYASFLDGCMEKRPDRVIDVGMAEQHAVGMAVGMAIKGKKPFLCFQSTFMQRAFDQIIHDICFMKLPITIMAVRSGFAGYDSHTHHGIYDISYLRSIPNLSIFYPGSSYDLESIIEARSKAVDGPLLILYPYEGVREDESRYQPKEPDINKIEILYGGKDGYIISVGNTLDTGIGLKRKLDTFGIDFGVINIRWLVPLPRYQLVERLKNVRYIVTTEENVLDGGFGSSIAEMLVDEQLRCDLLRIGIDRIFVQPGDKKALSKAMRIDPGSIIIKMQHRWNDLFQ